MEQDNYRLSDDTRRTDELEELAQLLPEEDLLGDATELPTLFPEAEKKAEDAPLERPRRRNRRWYHTLLRVLAVVLKYVVAIVLTVAILAGGLVGYLTVTEYTPAYAEAAQMGTVRSEKKLNTRTLRLMTFNTGYAALGEDADFFMDGGKGVRAASEETVVENMIGIEELIKSIDADVLLLQEVDTDSDRSYHRNQWQQYEHDLGSYESYFALNYSCRYVPYPLSERIGEVHSGIATYSRYAVRATADEDDSFEARSATRYSLPCPFSWPVRVANLKRCLLLTRIPLENSDRELVVINLHLEAYEDGEGRIEQTRRLMELMEQEYAKGNYVIAGGDFNQSFPNAEAVYPVKNAELWQPGRLETPERGWSYVCDTATPSCRLLNQPYAPSSPETQYYVIDGFLVSPNITVDSVETVNAGFVNSDHNPVVVEITLD